MSKESYARGFVKAAAAAGVDPVKLAKHAQARTSRRDLVFDPKKGRYVVQSTPRGQELVKDEPKYRTNGWAPLFVRSLGKSKIPFVYKASDIYYPNTQEVSPSSDEIPSGTEQDSILGMDLKGGKISDKQWAKMLLNSYDTGDGELYNWYRAHRDALDAARSVFKRGLFWSNYDDAAKAYHQSMLSSTGTPVRVHSQIKK